MAKSLLLNTLVDFLGNYVEGLTAENLKVGVWSGKIVLRNLKLKDTALQQLPLPVRIVKASLKMMKIKIPWTQLGSKPVEIQIDGLYLLVTSLDISQISPHKAKQLVRANRANRLKQIDDKVLSGSANGDGLHGAAKKASYFQSMASSIADNLEFHISNIHLRYEDYNSIPGRTFSFGFTIEKISLATTDENWNAAFVRRDAATTVASVINKLGVMENFGCYWNAKDRSLEKLNNDAWEDLMQLMIFKSDLEEKSKQITAKISYIINPGNMIFLKFVNRQFCNESIPKVDVSVESSSISINLDKDQYCQLLLLLKNLDEIDRWLLMCVNRPAKRATEDPRGWWHYAYGLVTSNKLDAASQIKAMVRAKIVRKEYVSLAFKVIVDDAKKVKDSPAHSNPRLIDLEATLPLRELLIFREEAANFALTEIKRLKEKEQQEREMLQKKSVLDSKSSSAANTKDGTQKKSFFQSMFGSNKPSASSSPRPLSTSSSDLEDMQIMQELESKLAKISDDSNAAINQAFSFRAVFKSCTVINVTWNSKPLIEIDMFLEMTIEARYMTLSFLFSMSSLSVIDNWSRGPVDKCLIRQVKDSTHSKQAPLTCDLILTDDKVQIIVKAAPLITNWNKDCVAHLIDYFTYDIADSNMDLNPLIKSSFEKFNAEARLRIPDTEILIEYSSQQIVFPENAMEKSGFAVFNTGYLRFEGMVVNGDFQSVLKLKGFNVFLAEEIVEEVDKLSANGKYLIEPVDLGMNLEKNLGTALMINLEIVPLLQIQLDTKSLEKLLKSINVVVSTFDPSAVKRTRAISNPPPPSQPTAGQRRRSIFSSEDKVITEEKKATPDNSPASLVRRTNLDYGAVTLRMTFVIPEFVVTLHISDTHVANLSLNRMKAKIIMREADTTALFSLNSVHLKDSNRTERFPALFSAEAEDKNGDVLFIEYKYITNKLSPLFAGYSEEIAIQLKDISTYFDVVTLCSYKELIDDIMKMSTEPAPSKQLPPVRAHRSNSIIATEAIITKISEPTATTRKFSFDVSGISFQILDVIDESSSSLTTASVDRQFVNGNYFESGFCCKFGGLSLTVNTDGPTVALTSSLLSLEIVDIRPNSSSKSYYSSLLRGGKVEGCSDALLNCSFSSDSFGAQTIDLSLNNFIVFVAADVYSDLSDSIQEINYAVKMLMSIQAVEDNTELDSVSTKYSERSALSPKETIVYPISVTLSMTNLRLLLLEDPSKKSSRAIETHCNLSTKFVRDVVSGVRQQDNLVLSFTELETVTITDLSLRRMAHKIVEPITSEVHYSANDTECYLAINNTKDILIKLSLKDLALLQNIMNRASNRSGTLVADDEESDAATKKTKAAAKKSAEVVSNITYNIQYKTSRIKILLVNDLIALNIPLFRFEVRELEVLLGGQSDGLDGVGTALLACDYYNSEINKFEPVMEEWKPQLLLKVGSSHIGVDLSHNDHLQWNWTGELLRTMIVASEAMRRIKRTVYFPEAFPLQICNEIGLGLDILDSKTGKFLLRLNAGDLSFQPLCLQEVLDSGDVVNIDATEIDILFTGSLADRYAPIRKVSTRSRKVKVIPLIDVLAARASGRGSVESRISNYSQNNPSLGNSFSSSGGSHGASGDYITVHIDFSVDDTRVVHIRGTKLVFNGLQEAVDIQVDSEVFRVDADNVIGVPLPLLACQGIRIRPSTPGFHWSSLVPLAPASVTNRNTQRGSVRTAPPLSTITCMNAAGKSRVFGYELAASGFTLDLKLFPVVKIVNYLPCEISCEFVSSNKEAQASQAFEIKAGAIVDAFTNSLSDHSIETVFSIGLFTGTSRITVPGRNELYTKQIEIRNKQTGSATSFSCQLRCLSSDKLVLEIFASILFMDRTMHRFRPIPSVRNSSAVGNSVRIDRSGSLASAAQYETMRMEDCWARGDPWMSFFEPSDGKFSVVSSNGCFYLADISLKALGVGKVNYELFDPRSSSTCHVTLHSELYPLAPDLTHVISVIPTYSIVNHTSKKLFVQQRSSGDFATAISIAERSFFEWYSPGKSADLNLFLRSEDSDWSLGTFNMNEIGASTMLLPLRDSAINGNSNGNNFLVLSIQVKFADANDKSFITVVIWESKIMKNKKTGLFRIPNSVGLSIKNDSDVAFIISQGDINIPQRLKASNRSVSTADVQKFYAIVGPGEWVAYGWTDLEANPVLLVRDMERGTSSQFVNTLEIGKYAKVGYQSQRAPIYLKMKSQYSGRCLHIFQDEDKYLVEEASTSDDSSGSVSIRGDSAKSYSFRFCFESIGVSIIAERPTRREIMCINYYRFELTLQQFVSSKSNQSFEMKLQDIQVDNYTENSTHAVTLCSKVASEQPSLMRNKANDYVSDQDLPFLDISMFRQSSANGLDAVVKFFAFRMLEFYVSIDSATIMTLISDFYPDLSTQGMWIGVNTSLSAKKALVSLDKVAYNFNMNLKESLVNNSLSDVDRQYLQSQSKKYYIESLIIHPMKINLSFSQNESLSQHSSQRGAKKALPPSLQGFARLEMLTSIEDFTIKINSFITNNVMESTSQIIDNISQKVSEDMKENLLKLGVDFFGSMSLLGKPAGLYKKVGTGVQDFFYEPYTGLMHSPPCFITGLGIGTGKLIYGVTTGVVGSTANIVGAASSGLGSIARGVANISGNEAYVKKSEERKRDMKSSGGGVLAGFKAGGESLFTGVSSGITGLVTAPIKGGQKEGAVGFFKGVGKGIIGVAVNPVMGVTDGISSIAQGINQQLSHTASYSHARRRRALTRVDPEVGELYLSTLDWIAAEAQHLVERRAVREGISDFFLIAGSFGFDAGRLDRNINAYGYVLSLNFLSIFDAQFKVIWRVPSQKIIKVKDFIEKGSFLLEIVYEDGSSRGGHSSQAVHCRSADSAHDASSKINHFHFLFDHSGN